MGFFSLFPTFSPPLPNLTPPHLLRRPRVHSTGGNVSSHTLCLRLNSTYTFSSCINNPNVQLFTLFLILSYRFLTLLELQKLEKQRHRCYEELRERIEREKKMKTVSEELQLQKHLMVRGIDLFCFCTFYLQTKLTNSEPRKVLIAGSRSILVTNWHFFFFF